MMNIKPTSIINLVIVLAVMGVIFYTMSPNTNNGSSMFTEMTFIALGVFLAVVLIRMVIASRRKNTKHTK